MHTPILSFVVLITFSFLIGMSVPSNTAISPTYAAVCGDQLCGEGEEYTTCPQDCPPPQKSVRDQLLESEKLHSQEMVTVGDIKKASKQLGDLLEQQNSLAEHIGDKYSRELEALQRLEQLEEEKITLTEQKLFRELTHEVSTAARKDAIEMRTIVAKEFLSNPSVRQLLVSAPPQLYESAERGDLESLASVFPPSTRPFREIAEEMDELSVVKDLFSNDIQRGWFSLVYDAFAQQENSDSPKDRFKSSVELMNTLRKQAADPEERIASLEDRLNHLIERRHAIAGVVGIAEEKVQNDLSNLQQTAQDPSTKELIKASGVLAYIASTANFQELRSKVESATSSMRSGWGRVTRLFAQAATAQAEAASLLEKGGHGQVVSAMRSGTLEERTIAIRSLVESQKSSFEKLLLNVPEEERKQYEQDLNAWQSSIENVQSIEEVREAMEGLQVILDEVQQSARIQVGTIARLSYGVQDFFGIN